VPSFDPTVKQPASIGVATAAAEQIIASLFPRPSGPWASTGKPDFWISDEGSLNRSVHIAITAKDRRGRCLLSRRHRRRRQGQGAPGLRPHYQENYYGAFVFNPDSHNIEAVCHAPA
jgi:hypothetical protein